VNKVIGRDTPSALLANELEDTWRNGVMIFQCQKVDQEIVGEFSGRLDEFGTA
jgi:hypothetical protein